MQNPHQAASWLWETLYYTTIWLFPGSSWAKSQNYTSGMHIGLYISSSFDSQQGSHCLYNLAKNGVLMHCQFTLISMTSAVIEKVKTLPRQMAWTGLCCMANMENCSMIPLGLQEWTIQINFMATFIKTQTIRTLSNKKLILKRMMKFQKV